MQLLADTTVTVSSGELTVITVGILVALCLQVWALAETVTRRRWVWLIAIWVTFPIGTLAWLAYGRWQPRPEAEYVPLPRTGTM